MASTREPWIKLKIGVITSDKVASLSDDSAWRGWITALVLAKTQRRMGVFISRGHLAELLGRRGVYVDEYTQRGLLHVAPVLCADCARRHVDDNLDSGNLVVHDYLVEQRDPTNAERQAAWRAAHHVDRDGNVTVTVTGTVTPPTVTQVPDESTVTHAVPPPVTPEPVTSLSRPEPPGTGPSTDNGDITPDSPARGMTVTVTETVRRRRTKKDVLDEELDRAAAAPVRAAVVDELDFSDPNRAGRLRPSSEPRALTPPAGIAAVTPGWRLPCTNYVAHQSQHRILDGQAVCPPCEDAAAAAGTFPPADRPGDLWSPA